MKHEWEIIDRDLDGGPIPHNTNVSPKYPKANAVETIYLVRCRNCDAIVWTVGDRITDNTVHCDWHMEADCNLQKIRMIHES